MPLTRLEPKDRDMTANGVCLQAIVAPTRVDLLRKPIHPYVVIGVGDLTRQKFFVAEFAFRMRLEVVVPLRVFGAAEAVTIGSGPSWK